MNWTVARVKEELPEVKVRCSDGVIMTGRVLGRLMDFATVEIRTGCVTARAEFSWIGIANALNGSRPLRF